MKEVVRRRSNELAVGERKPVITGGQKVPFLAVDKNAESWWRVKKSETFHLMYVDNSVAVIKNIDFRAEGCRWEEDISFSQIVVNTSDSPKRTYFERSVSLYKKVELAWHAAIIAVVLGSVFMAVNVNALFLLVMIPSVIIAVLSGVILDKIFVPCFEVKECVEDRWDKAKSAEELSAALAKHPNPQKVTALIRHKYLLSGSDVNSSSFLRWVNIVVKIINLDSEYEVDLIPMETVDAQEILDKMFEMKANQAARASKEKELESKAAAEVRDESAKWMRENSLEVKALAMARLESLDQWNKD